MVIENQGCADLNNGYYLNPIMAGDYPDPSVLRLGSDYYMTHSLFKYGPGLLIWHSRDLVNWEPVCNAIKDFEGDIWAPDFIHYKGTFYIYYHADGTNWVITAPSPEGPWSEPIDLKIGHIDPGHCVGPDGKRYIHLSGGYIVQLSDDGLSTVGEVKKVYNGWRFPEEWNVEGFCLESPKITYKDGYYYLTVAEGGTAGPSTSHMVVSSRSITPWGPWEHSPYNPIIHTGSRRDRWWSRGHGTLVDTPEGDWWIMYHAYEKDYYTLGRQTLLEPIEWTDDGWFYVPYNIKVDKPIKKPGGKAVPHGLKLSDSFTGNKLGMQWRFFGEYNPKRLKFDGNGLALKAKGLSPADSSPMLCIPVNHAYEAQVSVKVKGTSEGGMVLYYNPSSYCGIGFNGSEIVLYCRARKLRSIKINSEQLYLRLINNCHDVSFYYSKDSQVWHKIIHGMETSGYHHNVFGGFMSLRLGVYSAGDGEVIFKDFNYNGLK